MPSPTTVVTGTRAKWGVSDCGQLMGTPAEAGLASIEPEGIYEHLAIGVLEEDVGLAVPIEIGHELHAPPRGRAQQRRGGSGDAPRHRREHDAAIGVLPQQVGSAVGVEVS